VGDPAPAALRAGLEAAGFGVTAAGLSGIDPAEMGKSHAVLLAVTSRVLGTAQALCRRWRIELGEQYVPIIWLAAGEVPPGAGLDAGADAVLNLRTTLADTACVLLDAPSEVRREVDPWGIAEGPALELMRRVKQRFDPDGVLV